MRSENDIDAHQTPAGSVLTDPPAVLQISA